jgi:hypothetical protein
MTGLTDQIEICRIYPKMKVGVGGGSTTNSVSPTFLSFKIKLCWELDYSSV